MDFSFVYVNTDRPVNDQVVRSRSSANDIAGVLVRHILGCETDLGVP